jgi:hypothetical protein
MSKNIVGNNRVQTSSSLNPKKAITVKSIMNIDLKEQDYNFIRQTLSNNFLIKNLDSDIMYNKKLKY